MSLRRRLRSGTTSGAVAVTYGQYGDLGETDDPTIDATTYSASVIYQYGDMVLYSAAYYICVARPTYANASAGRISGITPNSDVTRWWPCSSWIYLDNTATPATGVMSATPATAKASPFSSLAEVYALTRGASAGTTPRYTVILGKRGQTYTGNMQFLGTSGGNHALFYVGAWGTRVSARPTIELRDNNAVSCSSCVMATYTGGHAGDTGFARYGAVASGGTGYTLGDTLTVVGGTFTTATQLSVSGIDAGVVTDFTILVAGSYTIQPSDDTTTTTTGGTGTGCTVSVRYGPLNVSNHAAGLQVRNWVHDGIMSFFVTITPVSSTLSVGDTILGSTSACQGTIITKATNYCQVQYTAGTGDTVHGFVKSETVTVTAGINVGATGTLPATNGGWSGSTGITIYDGQDTGLPPSAVTNYECKNMASFGVGCGWGRVGTPNFSIGGSGDNFYQRNNYIHNVFKLGAGSSGLTGNGSSSGIVYGQDVVQIYNTWDGNGNGSTSHNIYNIALNKHVFQYNRSNNSEGYGYNIHEVCMDLRVEDNIFDGNNNGIGHQAGYPTKHEAIIGVTTKRNYILNSGVGKTQGYGMIVDITKNHEIWNNVWAGNVILDCSIDTSILTGSKQLSTNITFYHNSHYQPEGSFGGFDIDNSAKKNIVGKNNAFYSLGTNTGTNKEIFSTMLVNSELDWDYNVYYIPNKTGGQAQQVIRWVSTNYTLAAFQAGPGATNTVDDHTVYGNPLYTTPSTGDLRVTVGSPCINAGTPIAAVTTDFNGKVRSATTPTIGAFEY